MLRWVMKSCCARDLLGLIADNNYGLFRGDYLSPSLCCTLWMFIVNWLGRERIIVINITFIKSTLSSFFFGTDLLLLLLLILLFLNYIIVTEMKSAAFLRSYSTVKILSYYSLSSKSSNVSRDGWFIPIFWVWLPVSMLGFDRRLNVSTIDTALCSITAKNTNKLDSETVLDPPISLTIYLLHSMVSKRRYMMPMTDLASFWWSRYLDSISLKLF